MQLRHLYELNTDMFCIHDLFLPRSNRGIGLGSVDGHYASSTGTRALLQRDEAYRGRVDQGCLVMAVLTPCRRRSCHGLLLLHQGPYGYVH